MFNRFIDVEQNLVWFTSDKFQKYDCSKLKDLKVTKVIEDMSDIWVEREPFNGREYDIDFSIAYQLFSAAELAHNQETKAEKYRRSDYLEPYKVLCAIHELNLHEKWEQWLNDSSRTFLEKVYINHHPNWDRNCSIIQNAFVSMGLTKKDVDRVWNLGLSYNKKTLFE